MTEGRYQKKKGDTKKKKGDTKKKRRYQKKKKRRYCQRNSMFLTHSASGSNSVVCRLIQSCHVFFCAARDDRRLVVESLLCVFSIRSFLSDLES